jgi:hypothetical protein
MLRLKTRDGIPFSEQIRRALEGFLVEKGIRKKPPKDRPVTVGRARIEPERETLRRELAALDRAGKAAHFHPKSVERELRKQLEDWRTLLRRHIPLARQVLKKLLAGSLVFSPVRDGGERYYEFRAPIALGRILTGLACANMVASPTSRTSVVKPKIVIPWPGEQSAPA